MQSGWNQNRAVIVMVAVIVLVALANDALTAVSALYTWAQRPAGQAALLVGVGLIALWLVVDRLVEKG